MHRDGGDTIAFVFCMCQVERLPIQLRGLIEVNFILIRAGKFHSVAANLLHPEPKTIGKIKNTFRDL